jgi:hypothetical protein
MVVKGIGPKQPTFPEPGRGKPQISQECLHNKEQTCKVAEGAYLHPDKGVDLNSFGLDFSQKGAADKASEIADQWLY